MKDYTTDTPEFSDVIKVIETSDPVHAEIPNITFRQLFQNTLCNRKLIKNPEFDDSGEVEGITGKESLLNKLVSGIPLVKWMQNVKAGFSLALYVGELVNNCVTDRADLPLSAAQGKVLMDLYTQLYSDLDFITDKNSIKKIRFHTDGGWMLYIHIYLVDGNTYAIGINTAGDIMGFINNVQKWIK